MTNSKEAKARIKINKMLEQAGWQYFDHAEEILKTLEENIT